MTIAANSRYLLTNVVQVVDTVSGEATQPPFMDLRDRVDQTSPDDIFVTVDGSMSWGSLGRSLLGDARNYWVIADLSGVIDPFSELVVGSVLRAPSTHRLLFDILAPTNTST